MTENMDNNGIMHYDGNDPFKKLIFKLGNWAVRKYGRKGAYQFMIGIFLMLSGIFVACLAFLVQNYV